MAFDCWLVLIHSWLNCVIKYKIVGFYEGFEHEQIKMTNQVLCKMTDWLFEDDRPPYDT